MQGIPDSYALENIEQVRALADELRIRIVDQLILRPMTVTQVGEALGIAPNKIHYHVRELERLGLVVLAETKEKGGILEKYYRSVAKNFNVPDELLRATTPDEIIGAVREFLQVVNQGLLDALGRASADGVISETVTILSATSYWATNAEAKELASQIQQILQPYSNPRDIEGEQERRIVSFSHTLSSEVSETQSSEVSETRKPKWRHALWVGSAAYSRGDLEAMVARSEQFDVRVIGSCTFADDIPASLVEQAIGRFHIRGTLHASEAIQNVLRNR
jgi:DNA-binding transcriptional ArsR family regulator